MRRLCVSNKPTLPRIKICKHVATGRLKTLKVSSEYGADFFKNILRLYMTEEIQTAYKGKKRVDNIQNKNMIKTDFSVEYIYVCFQNNLTRYYIIYIVIFLALQAYGLTRQTTVPHLCRLTTVGFHSDIHNIRLSRPRFVRACSATDYLPNERNIWT
jgi:hypothetical protein